MGIAELLSPVHTMLVVNTGTQRASTRFGNRFNGGMHVDLRDLKYFEVIAELEHIGRAAERLDKTQPALTNCVRRLEDECGAILLEKAGRGVRLTAAGHVLWKWAQRARVDAESACREIGNIG